MAKALRPAGVVSAVVLETVGISVGLDHSGCDEWDRICLIGCLNARC